MKNWIALEADINLIMTKHFTPGRAGKTVKFVEVHHNAANLSAQQIYNVWQTREASAHYQVDANGVISQHVWDRDTAWHATNLAANQESIGVEHANNTFAPGWTISDKTLEEGSHLVAAICVAFKLGRPAWLVNVFPHSYHYATACPGAIGGSQNAAYMRRAGEWYDAMMAGTTAPPAPPTSPGGTYVVQPGDSLYAIAKRAGLRDWHPLYDANRDAIGPNPDVIQPGTELVIPGGASSSPSGPSMQVGGQAKFYGTRDVKGTLLAKWTYGETFTVMQIDGSRVVIGRDGDVTAAVSASDLTAL